MCGRDAGAADGLQGLLVGRCNLPAAGEGAHEADACSVRDGEGFTAQDAHQLDPASGGQAVLLPGTGTAAGPRLWGTAMLLDAAVPQSVLCSLGQLACEDGIQEQAGAGGGGRRQGLDVAVQLHGSQQEGLRFGGWGCGGGLLGEGGGGVRINRAGMGDDCTICGGATAHGALEERGHTPGRAQIASRSLGNTAGRAQPQGAFSRVPRAARASHGQGQTLYVPSSCGLPPAWRAWKMLRRTVCGEFMVPSSSRGWILGRR